jgi:23S rRNA (cytosine1962-C5)-methyltransferase
MRSNGMPSPLDQALARRTGRAEQNREVCRLIAGEHDGFEGLVVDRLGDYAFATCHDEPGEKTIELLRCLVQRLALRGLSLRSRAKGGQGREILCLGETLPERIELFEGEISAVLRIHPESLSYGLFPDLRLERLRVAQRSAGLKVLNLYAYSGLFGIHAAHGGALDVVQVDALKSMLNMIDANEKANAVSTRRICDDALSYCQRAARRGHSFDLVIHDPPTFGRDPKGRSRSTKKSLVEMLSACLSVVADGGLLLSIVNTASMSTLAVDQQHEEAAQRCNKRIRRVDGLRICSDSPSPLKGGWYEVNSIR